MPSNLTDAISFDQPVAVPSDGDVENVASVNPNAFQKLANRTFFLGSRLAWNWCGKRPVLSCTDGVTVVVGANNGAMVQLANGYPDGFPASTSTNITTSGMTPSTWYYVYAFRNGGVVNYEFVTTLPDASLSFKNTDVSKIYVGCFFALGAASVQTFRAVNGRYTYTYITDALLLALNGGTAAAFTDVALAALVPPHARIAKLFVHFKPATSSSELDLCEKGSGLKEIVVTSQGTTAADERPFECEIGCDSAQKIQYKVSAGAVSIAVRGFIEP